MSYQDLSSRLGEIRERIAEHQRIGGWTHPVTIVAVTKGHPAEAVRAAARSGLTIVGENRVQEALAKQDLLADLPVTWHLIGSLQRNKARQAVGKFGLIHSVDRVELASELARRCPPGFRQPILIQVNCSDERQKGGVEVDGVRPLVDVVLAEPSLELRGLMTMAELTDDVALQRRAFRRLREARASLDSAGIALAELSMGMSDDFPTAVEEGATMIRLGTVLFGPRPLR
ncbi:MAG: YggS family pyridoxal phosphate-dependent enzyme [Gemmatimonadales bacterium]